MSEGVDFNYKIVLLGDSGVGKTSLIRAFISGNEFSLVHAPTQGIDCHKKLLQVGNMIIKLKIWDTAGTERFQSLASSYYRDATGVLIIFDVTNEWSFINVAKWLDIARDKAEDGAIFMLVANKIDCDKIRVVATSDIQLFASKNNCALIEVSAKNNDNVYKCFENLTISVQQKFNTSKYSGKSNNTESCDSSFILNAEFKKVEKTKGKINISSKNGCC